MTAHWCLLAVINGFGRCELLTDEVLGMTTDRLNAHPLNIGEVLGRQLETASELAPRKLCKGLGLSHFPFPDGRGGLCLSALRSRLDFGLGPASPELEAGGLPIFGESPQQCPLDEYF